MKLLDDLNDEADDQDGDDLNGNRLVADYKTDDEVKRRQSEKDQIQILIQKQKFSKNMKQNNIGVIKQKRLDCSDQEQKNKDLIGKVSMQNSSSLYHKTCPKKLNKQSKLLFQDIFIKPKEQILRSIVIQNQRSRSVIQERKQVKQNFRIGQKTGILARKGKKVKKIGELLQAQEEKLQKQKEEEEQEEICDDDQNEKPRRGVISLKNLNSNSRNENYLESNQLQYYARNQDALKTKKNLKQANVILSRSKTPLFNSKNMRLKPKMTNRIQKELQYIQSSQEDADLNNFGRINDAINKCGIEFDITQEKQDDRPSQLSQDVIEFLSSYLMIFPKIGDNKQVNIKDISKSNYKTSGEFKRTQTPSKINKTGALECETNVNQDKSYVCFFSQQLALRPPDKFSGHTSLSTIPATTQFGSSLNLNKSLPKSTILGAQHTTLHSTIKDLKIRAECGIQQGDVAKQAHIVLCIALLLEQEQGSYLEAAKYLKRFYFCARLLEETQACALAINRLGVLYFKLKFYNRSLRYHLTHMELSCEQDLFVSYYNIGVSLRVFQKNEKAIQKFQKALDFAKKLNDIQQQCFANGQIGLTYLFVGTQRNANRAQPYLKKCVKLSKKIRAHRPLFQSLICLGMVQYLRKDVNSLKMFLHQAYEVMIQVSKVFNCPQLTEKCLCNIGITVGKIQTKLASETGKRTASREKRVKFQHKNQQPVIGLVQKDHLLSKHIFKIEPFKFDPKMYIEQQNANYPEDS